MVTLFCFLYWQYNQTFVVFKSARLLPCNTFKYTDIVPEKSWAAGGKSHLIFSICELVLKH